MEIYKMLKKDIYSHPRKMLKQIEALSWLRISNVYVRIPTYNALLRHMYCSTDSYKCPVRWCFTYSSLLSPKFLAGGKFN